MNKKTLIFSLIGVVLIAIVVAAFMSGNENTRKEPNKKAPQAVRTLKKDESIPPHRDNEEDLQKNVLLETRKLAERFATAYAALNPKKPDKYLKQIKPITGKKLLAKINEAPNRRPTPTIYKRKVLSFQTFPVDDVLPNRKKWNVVVFVRTSDKAGNAFEEQIWYWVSVAKEAGEWKITGFKVGE